MPLVVLLGSLAALSCLLTLWQWFVARRFPIHQRIRDPSFHPGVTLLKPLKGLDAETEASLKSWLHQEYPGPVQVLFGVESADDPVCDTVRQLMASHPRRDIQLIICAETRGANAKVSTLIQLQERARNDVLIVSDADVRVPPDLLANLVAPLRDPGTGLVNCFYRLANPTTPAMQWEAIATNADFWSQVLQAQSLRPIDFALGAVMAIPRRRLEDIGGFESLADNLADDYQLGRRIAGTGAKIVLSPVVVDCCDPPVTWRRAWSRQLRWSRTIRVCRPLPYFLTIISNATLWPLLLLLCCPPKVDSAWGRSWDAALTVGDMNGPGTSFIPHWTTAIFAICLLVRLVTAAANRARLEGSEPGIASFLLVPVKDLLNVVLWALAFTGSRVEWRGAWYRVSRRGALRKIEKA